MNAILPEKKFGKAVRRVEDGRFITGKGQYTDDIVHPGQTYMVLLRSPHAHAEILSIDSSAAAAVDSVHKVLTGTDYAASGLGGLFCGWPAVGKDGSPQKLGSYPPLADGKVRYVGNIVAAVIASSRDIARDAAELIQVDYKPLPAIADVVDAQNPDAPQLHDDAPGNVVVDWAMGDKGQNEAIFANADEVVSLELRNNRLVPNAMEPRASNAIYNAGTQEFTLHLSTQNPHGMKTFTSVLTGIAPEHKLRYIAPDVGGGFGSKAYVYPEDVLCLWASRETGQPVKWTSERSEAFLSDAHGRDHFTKAELALDKDGKFLAVRAHTLANMGGYLSTSATLIPTFMSVPLLSGQYDIASVYAEVDCVFTNTVPIDAYRGAGRPEAAYIIERLVDLAARKTGRDPAELRQKNFVKSFPYTNACGLIYDVGDFETLLEKATKQIDFKGFAKRKAASEKNGKKRGIGISTYIEACGFGPSKILGAWGGPGGAWESSEVRCLPTGGVEVYTGCMPHGQGHETVFAQYISDRLGVPMENIKLIYGDTDRGQLGNGTVGSRSGPVGIGALAKTTDKIVAKARSIARYILEANSDDDVEFEDGIFTVKNTNRSISFPEVAGASYAGHAFPTDEIEPGMHAASNFDPENFTYPSGCYICELEVDPQTGVIEILDFVVCDDFGNLGNPMIVEGQVHGGIVQGIGQALLEHCVYDETGQLLSGSFMDYCMPRADDIPNIRISMNGTPATANPMGMKGCGEAGAIGAPPAVINAITDALDIDHIDMPATPERAWRVANGLEER